MATILALWLLFSPPIAARCGCRYWVRDPQNTSTTYLFTNMLESDFTWGNDISEDTRWVRQQFDVTAEAGRGKYGKAFEPDNVRTRQSLSQDSQLGHSTAGLDLIVRSTLDDESIPSAEVDTARLDLHWGSYRAGMKLSDVNGTCAAFFWYFNDTQEIDIEFLSREFDRDKQIYPVNLVIQSRESMAAGYDAQLTGTYARVNLTFDPTAGFHEYRFDYVPGRVAFYADSVHLAEMKGSDVPSSAGHLILQHWSNGNPLWSGGPPVQDAVLTVSYVKAYFNSSDAARPSDWTGVCSEATNDKGGMCIVPDVTAANASDGGMFFDRVGDNQQEGSGGKPHTDGAPDTGNVESEGEGENESNVASAMLTEMASLQILMWLVVVLSVLANDWL